MALGLCPVNTTWLLSERMLLFGRADVLIFTQVNVSCSCSCGRCCTIWAVKSGSLSGIPDRLYTLSLSTNRILTNGWLSKLTVLGVYKLWTVPTLLGQDVLSSCCMTGKSGLLRARQLPFVSPRSQQLIVQIVTKIVLIKKGASLRNL